MKHDNITDIPPYLRVYSAELGERILASYPPLHAVDGAPSKARGTKPYWPGSLFRVHIEPALEVAGISGHVGWHTLRHTFGTLMKANGEDIKTIQELLRHANYKLTADVYTQAMTAAKRNAQSKVVRMILEEKAAKKVG